MDGWAMRPVTNGWALAGIIVGSYVVIVALIVAQGRLMDLMERRKIERTPHEFELQLVPWAQRNGWKAEHWKEHGIYRHFPLTAFGAAFYGTIAGRPAAIMWCGDAASRRFATLVVELPESYPMLWIRARHGFRLWWRNAPLPDAASDAAFNRSFKVHFAGGSGPIQLLTGPVRKALLRLRKVTGRHDDFFLLEGHLMRVTMRKWPRPPTVDRLLSATTDVIRAALPTRETDPWLPSIPARPVAPHDPLPCPDCSASSVSR